MNWNLTWRNHEEHEESVFSILRGRQRWYYWYSSVYGFKIDLEDFEEITLAEEKLERGWVLWRENERQQELDLYELKQQPSYLLLRKSIIDLYKHITTKLGLVNYYMIQFWGVLKVEGQYHYLSTSHHPFYVSELHKDHCWYRKLCMDYVYRVDVEGAEAEQFGSVGRVYLNKHPESTPDLRLYSTNEFPQRDHAARCGYRGYSALPLFDFHKNECYGVLEILSHDHTMAKMIPTLDQGLEIVGLRSTHINFIPLNRPGWTIEMPHKYKQQPENEITEILELCIKAVPRLSLAQVWTACKQCANMNSSLFCMERAYFINAWDKKVNLCQDIDDDMYHYLQACEFHKLQVDLNCGSLYDLSLSKGPLAHYAKRARLSHCLAICLESVSNSNDAYVIQFLLHPKCGEDACCESSVHLLFRTIEMKLKRFKLLPREQFPMELDVLSRQPNGIECESIDVLNAINSYNEDFSEWNFIEYIDTTDLCCLRPFPKSNEGWVFRLPAGDKLSKQDYGNSLPIQIEKIVLFMKKIADNFGAGHWIVQFWAPTMVAGRFYLETSGQPYALGCLAKGLASFRKKCLKHHYYVDGEAKEEELGPPGRVFRNGHPEITPDLFLYSKREFPIINYAMHCCLRQYFALPVFNEHNHKCVGVLELVGFRYLDLEKFGRALKEAELYSTHIDFHPIFLANGDASTIHCKENALKEVVGALQLITKIPQLQMANVWVPKGECVSINRNLSCMELALSTNGSWKFMPTNQVHWIQVQPRKGIVGMVLESDSKSCFCQNLCEFSIVDQPLSHYEMSEKGNACFAICLQSSRTGNLLYVLEFFLYQGPATYEYVRSFLNFLLPVMKTTLTTFQIANGRQLGEELVVEVIEFNEANKLASHESDQPDVFPIKFKNVVYNQKKHQHIEEQRVQSNPQVGQAKQGIVVASNFKKTMKGKLKTGLHLSLEVLKPHFGNNLEIVAKELGVGRSTIKRACRDYGITRWPSNKKQARNASLFERETSQDHQQIMRPSGSCSLHLSNTFLHKNVPNTKTEITQHFVDEAEKVMIKVKLGEANAFIRELETMFQRLNSQDKSKDKMDNFSAKLPHFEKDISDDDDDDIVEIIDGIQGPPKKKAHKAIVKERMVRSYALLPRPLKMLCSYAENELNDGKGIPIALEDDVFGDKCEKIYVHVEDIIPFCYLEPISGNCIVVYIWHLYNKMKEEDALRRFRFVNPFTISYVRNSIPMKREKSLADRLIVASPDQLVLVPCNLGEHWILTIIEPYKNIVSLLDPLNHCIRDESWKHVVDKAMAIFNANYKIQQTTPTWEVIKVPRQPDFKQCGYYVMRFMKEIVQGLNTIDSSSLSSLFVKREYSQSNIDEVCVEWTHCLLVEMCKIIGSINTRDNNNRKKNPSLFERESARDSLPDLWPSSSSNPRVVLDINNASTQNLAMKSEDEKIIIKVKFENKFLKFESCLFSGVQNVFNEIAMRLERDMSTFKLTYLDEDNDEISLSCDADLLLCTKTQKSLGKTCIHLLAHSIS